MKGNLKKRIKSIFSTAPPYKEHCGSSYVKEVTKQINNKTAAALAGQELYSHILDKADYYMELGYTEEQAFEMANEDMGDPKQTAAALNGLHGKPWYKLLQSYIALGLLIAELVVFFRFENIFNYSSGVPIMHRISVDFISLAFLASVYLLIRFAGKHNSKFICFCTCVFLGFQLFDNMLEPALYASARIFTAGFAGYTDSIYSYGLIPENIKGFLSIAAFVLVWILLIYCVLVFVGIFFRERGAALGRLFKPDKIISMALACALSLNSVSMVCCTAAAYINIDKKISENLALRTSAIDLVLNTDLSDDYTNISNEITNIGFTPYENLEESEAFYTYTYSNDNIQLALFDDKDGYKSLEFAVMSAESKLCLLNDSLGIDQGEADKFTEYMTVLSDEQWCGTESFPIMYTWPSRIITLDEFLDKGFYKNAHSIVKCYDDNASEAENESIDFYFLLENSQYNIVDFSFKHGKLESLIFRK